MVACHFGFLAFQVIMPLPTFTWKLIAASWVEDSDLKEVVSLLPSSFRRLWTSSQVKTCDRFSPTVLGDNMSQ